MTRSRIVAIAVVCAACAITALAQASLTGKWEGATPSGRPVVLDVKVKGQQLSGTLRVGQQTADIRDGKVDEKTFSFTATIDDRTATFTGRRAGDEVELTPEGMPKPVTLKRVK